MTKLGLVLAGGGGKGSYEIGVWKYLHEIGLDSQISVISGTSVGGLNAFLIGYGDYDLAERLWLTEVENRILDTESQSHKNDAIFSREGLLQIIDENIRFDRIQEMPKIYVTCYNSKKKQANYIKLNGLKDTEIKHFLLATSAIPIVFQKESINGNAYYDGGLMDNLPLRPLISEGCTHALIISLDKDDKNDYSGYDIKSVVIRPSCNLGSFVKGVLDFSSERTQIRIQLGYNDCKNIYNLQIKGLIQNNSENVEKMTDALAISKIQEINELNEKTLLLEVLKRISAEPILAGIVNVNMNAEFGTQGGKVFWTDLAEYNGWRWQQNKVFGQVRLLDPLNNRKAWGNYQKVVQKCREFLSNEVKREI